jgi:hypothetical protein
VDRPYVTPTEFILPIKTTSKLNVKAVLSPTPVGYTMSLYSNPIRKNINREYIFYVVSCYKYCRNETLIILYLQRMVET